MNNNDRPTIQHFDDFPFTGGVSAEIGNLVVCGRTGAGKTTLMQSIVDKYSADAVRMTGLYVFLLLAWWGGWLALDAWRIENLLTDADKWAGFRRDILWCAGSAALSLIFLMTGPNKKSSVYALSICLALIVPISVAIVAGSSFIHWEFDVPAFLMAHTCAGWVMTLAVPLVTFFSVRI